MHFTPDRRPGLSAATFVIVAALITVLCLLVIFACGCASAGTKHADAYALDTWDSTPTPNRAETVLLHGGAAAPAETHHYRERHTNTTTPPATAGQRVGAIVGTGLGIGTLGIIALAFFCPGVLAAFFLRLALKWRSAFVETVHGIEAAKVSDSTATLSAHLSAAQSPTTKSLVAQVKNP